MTHLQKSLAPVGAGEGLKSKQTQLCNHTTRAKCPPQGADLIEAHPRLLVFFGHPDSFAHALYNASKSRDAIAIQMNEPLENLDLGVVKGRSVVCFERNDTGNDYRQELACTIAAHGASEVALIPYDYNKQNAVFWGVGHG